MNKLRRVIKRNAIFIASLLLVSAILIPLISTAARPMSIQEFLLLDLTRNLTNIVVLRSIIFGLVILNVSLVYGLLTSWFGKRRAGLSVFVLASIPVWLIMQIALPRFTLALTPLLIALWAFDRAGRSESSAALWYALSGITTTIAWLQEPIGTTIIMVLCSLLLIGLKPRYAKHIARQATLVLIILIATVGVLSAADLKFDIGIQDYLVRQLTQSIHLTFMPTLFLQGPVKYYIGLPGVSLIPLSVTVLAGLGAWQLFLNRKRPRNLYLLVLPVLLGIITLQATGSTALLLLSVTMIAIASWAVMGVQYLHVSWKRVFPRNKLANSFGDLLIGVMLASLALYSFWYINKGWNDNPQARSDAGIEWNGEL